ncbi:MAG: hypothetical protein PHV85_04325 [Desulfovibrionaceae bacterium]|nr:3D domain-containing protein [Desulfovibrionaceae bacterium]MDD4951754.1 hypothetical protein [Desulfovibrionaceae bacterium]
MRYAVRYLAPPLVLGLFIWMAVAIQVKEHEIVGLRHDLELAKYTADARRELVEEARILQKAFGQRQVLKVTVTAYNPSQDQCDEDPFVAASMRKVRAGTVAVSRDLFDQGWVFGRKIRIDGLGIFEINDLMHSRFRRRVDVFMWDKDQALAFGKREFKVALLSI